MPFTLLLLLLSLVVIVPVAFVVIDKSRQQQLTHNNQHQRYITNKAKGDLYKTRLDLKIADTILAYRSNPKLPISFRQLLGKIHHQYSHLATVKLSPEQRFTVDKLAGTRLPEVLDDYLALEPDYAQNTIIDKAKNLTSQDVTYGQLTTMLDLMQRIADDGQEQVASNILASRGYLQSVYGSFYQDSDGSGSATQVVKAPDFTEGSEATLNEPSLYAQGESYLQDCDELLQIKPNADDHAQEGLNDKMVSANHLSLVQYKEVIGEPIITELGKLLHVAERTVTYTDALLHNNVSLQAFNQIISQAIPKLLRETIAERLNEMRKDKGKQGVVTDGKDLIELTHSQQELIEQKIARCGQLLEDCLTSLERVAKQQQHSGSITADTLQLLKNNIHSKQSQAQYLLDSGFFKV